MKMIGIVNSAAWDDSGSFAACFYQGLLDAGWSRPPAPTGKQPVVCKTKGAHGRYGGTYGNRDIISAIRGLGNVDLVIATGGNMSAVAAHDAHGTGSPPFVFLIGVMPGDLNSIAGNKGGVILDTPTQNQLRIVKLKTKYPTIDVTKIYLVQNANSTMGGAEATAWLKLGAGRVSKFFSGDNPDPDDSKAVQAAIDNSLTGLTGAEGLVISADPFFRDARIITKFTAALKTLGIPVCYPLKDYFDLDPKDQNRVWLGAPLDSTDPAEIPNTAYYKLGMKAGSYLTSPGDVGKIKWDAQNNMWVSV
jgi:hypothetical protein